MGERGEVMGGRERGGDGWGNIVWNTAIYWLLL